MVLKAIETRYRGYRFRSRLEARWAVFFDALDLAWRYEPQGFDLDGVWYLPDFWLPELGCWLEIKPESPDEEAVSKIQRFSERMYKNDDAFILSGETWPEKHRLWQWFRQPCGLKDCRENCAEKWYELASTDDGPAYWMECTWCILDQDKKSGNLPWVGPCLSKSWRSHVRGDHPEHLAGPFSMIGPIGACDETPRLMRAFEAARGARFEHGEQPR